MTITDIALEQVAAAYASETYTVPAWLTVGTEVITPASSDTELLGEIGDRESLSTVRSDKTVLFSGLRSSASVLESTGDTLTSIALLSASVDGDLHTIMSLPSIIQTTAYDIDFDVDITFDRR